MKKFYILGTFLIISFLPGCSTSLFGDEVTTPGTILDFEKGVDTQSNRKKITRRVSGLRSLVSIAVMKNPGLKAEYYLYKAALGKSHSTGALPHPSISWSYYARSVETRVGPQKHKFSINQKIPWLGKLKSATGVGNSKVILAAGRFDALKSQVLANLKTWWFKLRYLSKTIDIYKKIYQTSKVIKSLTLDLYKTRKFSISKISRMELETQILFNKIKKLNSKITPIKAKLGYYLGGTNYEFILGKNESLLIKEKSFKTLLAYGKRQNPILKVLANNIAVKNALLKSKKISKYPDFFFNATYIQTDPSSMPGITDNGKDPVILTLGISIPLFNSKESGEIEETKAMVSYYRWKRTDKEKELESTISKWWNEYTDGIREIKFYKSKLIPLAESTMKNALKGYATNLMELDEVWKIMNILLKQRLELATIRFKTAKAIVILEKLTGTTLFRLNSTAKKIKAKKQ